MPKEIEQHEVIFQYGSLAGQDQQIRILKAACAGSHVAHAWLVHGESGLGMELMGMSLARALLCQRDEEEACEECPSCQRTARLDHPDLKLVTPLPSAASAKARQDGSTADKGLSSTDPADVVAGKYLAALAAWREWPFEAPQVDGARQISVEQARHVKLWASLKSFEGRRRVCLVMDADKMGIQAQNALLKLLEEPPEGMVLILCSSRPEGLLPTIHSRCQQLRLRPVPLQRMIEWISQRPEAEGRDARLFAQMAGGNPGRAIELLRLDQESTAPSGKPGEGASADGAPNWDVVDFMRRLLITRIGPLYKTVTFMEGSRDREQIGRFLEELQDWIMDSEMLVELGEAESLSRMRRPLDRKAMLGLATRFRVKDRARIMESLMTASRQVNANVNVFSLLTVLCQRLKQDIEPIGTT